MGKPVQPTVDDVAKEAGVSTATVSRVINRPQEVRDALRERVQAAIAQLGYVPNAGARALMLNRSGTIGVVIPTLDNAIFARGVTTFQRRVAESGYQLLIASNDYDPAVETRQVMNLVARGADAVALFGAAQQPELLQFMRQRGLAHVHLGVWPPPGEDPVVGFDNAAAMKAVVRYLLDLGHRRFAMLAGLTQHNDRAAARLAGTRAALAAAGVPLKESQVVERAYDIAAAREGFRQLMAASPRPTAIVCGNDVLAFGALFEAPRLGLAVPADVSIVGFDDLEMARHLQPTLSTVRVPAETMWRAAADELVAAIEGRPRPGSVQIETELVVRESTGAAPAAKRR